MDYRQKNVLRMRGLFDSSKGGSIIVSRAWAMKRIDCTMKGITAKDGCGGACCKGNYYPAKANNGVCIWLGKDGCKLTLKSRPVKCLLYPFVIKNGKLILYGRALLHSCKPCYKKGEETIFENLRGNLIELFGKDEYEKVGKNLKRGRIARLRIPHWMEEQLLIERIAEERNENPNKRKLGNEES